MTTATTMQELLANLDDVVLQRTLSLEAYQSLAKLKEAAAKTDADNARLREQSAERLAQNSKLEAQLQAANERLKEIATREAAVAARESKANQNELAAAVAQAESKAFRHALGVVFAPNTVRESIMKYGSAVSNGMNVPTNEGGSVQHTEGYANPDNLPANGTGERTSLG